MNKCEPHNIEGCAWCIPENVHYLTMNDLLLQCKEHGVFLDFPTYAVHMVVQHWDVIVALRDLTPEERDAIVAHASAEWKRNIARAAEANGRVLHDDMFEGTGM